jgi:hypothetical protein
VVFEGIESSGNPIPAQAGARPNHAGKHPADAHAEVAVARHRHPASGAVPGEMR